jgi:hypothetical protein
MLLMVRNVWERLTCPAFDTAFFDAEDEDSTALDHTSALSVVETTRDAWNDALPRGMDEAEGIDGGLNVADEWRYVWVARHLFAPKFEVVGQLRGCGMVSYGGS